MTGDIPTFIASHLVHRIVRRPYLKQGCAAALAVTTILLTLNGPAIGAEASPTTLDEADLAGIPLKASEAEMQWFRDAKFGMFVHWGPCSLLGVELSWGRNSTRPFDINRHGPRQADPVYDNLYKRFNPSKFDAEQWIKVVKAAGMKYLVFVTKHHDGFSMFDTRYSDHDIAHTPYERDLVKQIADACHKHGIKLGLYYSPRDWYHPDYLTDHHERYMDFYHGQIEELCTNYGKVDIIWFDSIADSLDRWQPATLFRKIRTWQPGIIMNNRGAAVLGGYNQEPEELWGDYDTPEQRVGKYQTDRPWESCITLVGHQWSWKPGGKMMSLKKCVDTLVLSVCGDGNLLLNIGPMPTGKIEPRQIARLTEIGDWLKPVSESIYNTRGGPFEPGAWGGSTQRDKTIYVHVIDWDGKEELQLPACPQKIARASLLTGGQVDVRQNADGIQIRVTREFQQDLDTIIKLEIEPQ